MTGAIIILFVLVFVLVFLLLALCQIQARMMDNLKDWLMHHSRRLDELEHPLQTTDLPEPKQNCLSKAEWRQYFKQAIPYPESSNETPEGN